MSTQDARDASNADDAALARQGVDEYRFLVVLNLSRIADAIEDIARQGEGG